MKKLLVLALLAVLVCVAAAGCKSHPGSRDFIPGKGWQEN
jgi:hypothetical protein